MIIGLTGSIGSGKSTAAQRLASLGARVLDADAVSRDLTKPRGRALSAIKAAFGKEVFSADGALERRALAEIVFADADKRKALNAIIHPLVLETLQKKSGDILSKDPRAVVVWDVPLLIESGWQGLCDEVWLVQAPMEVRVARIVARDGCTREEALRRMQAQMSDEEKAPSAHEVIPNDGEREAFLSRVDALYRRASGGAA